MTNAGRRPVTAQDLTRLRGASDPQISPDGRRVAFVMTTASEERDDYLSNVWVVGVNGAQPRRLTTGPTKDTLPRWSPDGRWLAFVSDRGTKKKSQLYAMPADGGEATQLTDLPNGVFGQGTSRGHRTRRGSPSSRALVGGRSRNAKRSAASLARHT